VAYARYRRAMDELTDCFREQHPYKTPPILPI